MDDTRLQYLLDRLEIDDLIVAYARARDTTDAAAYRRIFAADASIRTGTGRVLSADREAILNKVGTDRIRFNPDAVDGQTSFGVMRHEPGNIAVTIDGDRARSDYYMKTLAFNAARQRPEVISAGRVEDDYERRDGRWWIVRSTLHFMWEHEEMGKALQVGPYTPAEYRR